MAKQVNTRLERRQIDGIEEMVDAGMADNQSEAHRMALDAGLADHGCANGHSRTTWLQLFSSEMSKVLIYLTVGWMGATLFFPVEFRFVSVYLFAATIGVVGVDRVLARLEPSVTDWMVSAFNTRSAGNKA